MKKLIILFIITYSISFSLIRVNGKTVTNSDGTTYRLGNSPSKNIKKESFNKKNNKVKEKKLKGIKGNKIPFKYHNSGVIKIPVILNETMEEDFIFIT